MEHITSRDGAAIAFWRSGSGPPLILVHGTTADHQRWAAITPYFEPHFTVYAIDRRGRSGSTDGPAYHILREAEDIAAVIESVGQPVFVLGHSYGATCSLEASLLTDQISRLILYEPPIPTGVTMYPPGTPDRMQALIDAGDPEAALVIMMREIVRMPDHEFEMYRQLPVWPVRVGLAHTIPREITFDRAYAFEPQKFAQMTVPTLLLLGGDSPAMFSRGIDVVDAALPNSQVALLPGQQHIAMDTNPDLFVQEVKAFLLD